MHRREFLSRSSLLLATSLLTRPRLFANSQPVPDLSGFKSLRRGVGTYTARGGTIGWLANPDALVAIDSQFPDTATDFLQRLPDRDDRKLDVLINTHHHPDHTAGNPVLGPAAARHVAQKNVPALQRARAERDLKLDQQVYASELFDTDWRLDVGDETISARHLGPAHTAGDIAVHFEKANIVHLGDLVFNGVYPVIDRLGGANIINWIAILGQLVKDYSADTRFIFGHGRDDLGVVGTRREIVQFGNFLERLRDLVRSEIVAGKPRVQVLARTSLPGFDDWLLPTHARFRDALGAVYDEFTDTSGSGQVDDT